MSEGTVLMLVPWSIVIGGLAVIVYRLRAYRVADRKRRTGRGARR